MKLPNTSYEITNELVGTSNEYFAAWFMGQRCGGGKTHKEAVAACWHKEAEREQQRNQVASK